MGWRSRGRSVAIEVVELSARMSLDTRSAGAIRCGFRRVAPEPAHALVSGPLSWTGACAAERGPDGEMRETHWLIYVLGLVESEAEEGMDAAICRLEVEIEAGAIRVGAHRPLLPADPLAGWPNAQLRAFRRAYLGLLEAS